MFVDVDRPDQYSPEKDSLVLTVVMASLLEVILKVNTSQDSTNLDDKHLEHKLYSNYNNAVGWLRWGNTNTNHPG